MRNKKYVFYILTASLILRLVLSPLGTLSLDQNTFIAWGRELSAHGFSDFYKGWSDYLPGYLYILSFLASIEKNVSINSVVLYKLPAILGDVGTGYLIYLAVKKLRNERLALVASLLYLFNPAILANSTLWGQVDSLTVFFSLLSIMSLDYSSSASAFSLAIGALIKPQAALAAPIVLFLMFKNKWDFRKIFSYIALSGMIFAVAFIPFNTNTNLVQFIANRLQTTLSQYPYTSINAFNFWGLVGFWKDDSTLRFFGLTIFLSIFLFSFRKLWKKKDSEFQLLSILFASNFLFFTRIHERHLLPSLALVLIAAFATPVFFVSYSIFSLTYIANMTYSYEWITNSFSEIFPRSLVILLICLNLVAFFLLVKYPVVSKMKINIKKIKKIKHKHLLFAVIVFAFVTRILFLSFPAHEYFDEVYHAFTARQLLHGDKKVWEWWNESPKGFAYEWTHPPVAKEAMLMGMAFFGENSLGWRMPSAILGTISVYLIYLISKKLFHDERLALLASVFYSLDGLSMVMARIGMNDTYFIFFMLLSYLMFLYDKRFFSALFLGFSLASKWSALWFIPILFVSHFALKKKFKIDYLWFLVLPIGVYLLTYLPMFFSGHSIEVFWGMQKQMWWYHTRLKATHAYSSSWWTWPLMIRPIWLFVDRQGNMISNIYAFGNPTVFLLGFFSIFAAAYEAFKKRSKALGLVVFSYFAFFVPWALSPRIMFIYHYLPTLPFMAIAIGYFLNNHKKYIFPLIILSFVSFIFFFPHMTGMFVPKWWDELYYIVPSWR